MSRHPYARLPTGHHQTDTAVSVLAVLPAALFGSAALIARPADVLATLILNVVDAAVVVTKAETGSVTYELARIPEPLEAKFVVPSHSLADAVLVPPVSVVTTWPTSSQLPGPTTTDGPS